MQPYVWPMLVHDLILPLATLSVLGWLYLLLGARRVLARRAEARPGAAGPVATLARCGRRGSGAQRGPSCRPRPAVADRPGLSRRLSIILVDDHSEDATRAIAKALPVAPGAHARGDRRAAAAGGLVGQAVGGVRRPAPRRALRPQAPYVLLTDADIAHDPGNLRRLVARAQRGSSTSCR